MTVKSYIRSAISTTLFVVVFFALTITSSEAYSTSNLINICGDSSASNNSIDWTERSRAVTDGVCSGRCTSSSCTGSLRVYSCTKGQETYQNGAITCTNFEKSHTGTISYSSEFSDPCKLKRIEVSNGSGYSDFVIYKGSNFDSASCSPTTPVSSSPMYSQSNRYSSGNYVNVCGYSPSSDPSIMWSQHNANSLCQGCSKDNSCAGSNVQVYKCYYEHQVGSENGGLKCEYDRVNGYSGYESFSTWFTNSYEFVQIDVFDGNGNLKDFVVWRGDNFGKTVPTPVPTPYITPNPTPNPTPLPTPPPPVNPECRRAGVYQTFPDVPASNPYFTNIQNLECENVVHGYTDGTFKPTRPITRGEMAKIIENGYRFPENTRCLGFNDVPRTNKFYVYIMTLKCTGVIGGYSDGTFRPDALVTREEAMKFIVNGSRKVQNDSSFLVNSRYDQVFNDVPSSNKFFDFINATYSNAIIDPNYPYGEFRPSHYMNRQEMSFYVDNVRLKMEERGWGRYN